MKMGFSLAVTAGTIIANRVNASFPILASTLTVNDANKYLVLMSATGVLSLKNIADVYPSRNDKHVYYRIHFINR